MDTNKICTIYTDQIETFCTHCIVVQHTDVLYFLSIAGFQVAVKAITASFIQGSHISISKNKDEQPYSIARGSFNYTFKSRKLPSGLFQTIILPKSILEKPMANESNNSPVSSVFLIKMIPEITEEDIAVKFLTHYAKYTDLPLHKSWALPLWEYFNNEYLDGYNYDIIHELETIVGDINGYLINHDDIALQNIISDKLKSNVPDFTNCFKDK